jgi:hypothetical protein
MEKTIKQIKPRRAKNNKNTSNRRLFCHRPDVEVLSRVRHIEIRLVPTTITTALNNPPMIHGMTITLTFEILF